MQFQKRCVKVSYIDGQKSQYNYTNKTVMRIGGLILNSTRFFPLFESADVLSQPNSSHKPTRHLKHFKNLYDHTFVCAPMVATHALICIPFDL